MSTTRFYLYNAARRAQIARRAFLRRLVWGALGALWMSCVALDIWLIFR
jgi:hypothetical protein